MYEQMLGLGGDSSIYRVYEALGRIVDLSEIVYDHHGHSSVERVMTPDRTAAEMRAKSWANPVDPFTFDISREVELLKKHIEEKNK